MAQTPQAAQRVRPRFPGTTNQKAYHYSLAALRERYAALTAKEARLRSIRESTADLDGALRTMSRGSVKGQVALQAGEPVRTGQLNAMIFDVLRLARRHLTTAEVADGIAKAMGLGADAAAVLKARVRANLLYLSKARGLVAKAGSERVRRRVAC